MAALPKTGLELVLKGFSEYVSGLNQAANAEKLLAKTSKELAPIIASVGPAMKEAAKGVRAFGSAVENMQLANVKTDIAGMTAAATTSADHTEMLARSLSEIAAAAKAAQQPMQSLGQSATATGGQFNAMREIAVGALRDIGGKLVDVAGQTASMIAGFATDSVSTAGDFEAGMFQFEAAAGGALQAAGLSVEDFKQQFLAIGKELPVSTTEVQQAAITLIKGGLDPAVVAAGALTDSLLFAAAAEMDLASGAELGIKMLGTFGPTMGTAAEQTAFLANAQDLMVKAAGASTLDVAKLGDAMLAAGGQASAAGVDYQDFVTTMGLISPSFGSAAEAGTSYKNMLVRLQPSTKPAIAAMEELGLFTKEAGSAFFDATGTFVGNQQAAELLQNALSGLSDAERLSALQTIFGNDAMGAAVALANAGGEGYAAFAASMQQANGVQAQAAMTQQGYNIALDGMKGSFEALQITLGSALLPLLTDLFNNVLSPGIDVLSTLTSAVIGDTAAFNELSPALQTVATTLGLVGQYIGEAMGSFETDGFSAAIATFAAGLSEISPMAGQLVGALAPLGDLIQGNLIPILVGVATVVGGVAVAAFVALTASIAPVVGAIAGLAAVATVVVAAWQSNFGNIQGIVSGALGGIAGIVSGVLSTVMGFWNTYGGQIVASATATWNTLTSMISAVMGGILAVVQPILAIMASFWAENGASIMAFVASTWSQINSIIQSAMQLIMAVVVPVLTSIGSFIASHSSEIQAIFTGVWNAVSGIITTALNLIQDIIQTVLKAVQGDWGGAWEELKSTSVEFVTGIWEVIKDTLGIIPPLFTTMIDGAVGILTGAIGTFVDIGSNIIMGIIDGINNTKAKIDGIIRDIARNALNSAKAALGIQSPSRVAAEEIGMPFVEGWAIGIAQGGTLIDGAGKLAAQNLVISTQGALAGSEALGQTFIESVGYGIEISEPELVGKVKGLGEKIAGIETELQNKLIAIDTKAAEQRAKVARDLVDDIEQSQAAMLANAAANDFDLFGDLSEDQANSLKIREEAEKNYIARVTAAREEARTTAQEGDAQLAKDVLDAKEKEAAALQKIEEQYMQKRAEVNKDQLPELEATYMRAVELRQDQTRTEIELAEQSAKERSQVIEKEKQAAVSSAQEQADGVIDAAKNQAEGVGKATGQATASAVTSTEPEIKQAGTKAGEAAVKGAEEGGKDAPAVGKNIASGIASGITANTPAIASAAKSAAESALSAAKDALGIHSPSRVAADEISLPFVQGIVQGVTDNLDMLKGMSRHLSKQLTEDMKRVAEETAAAFTQVLQDKLKSRVTASNTALSNTQALQELVKGSGTGDALDEVRETEQEIKDLQAKFDALKREGNAALNDPERVRQIDKEDRDYFDKRNQQINKVNEAYEKYLTEKKAIESSIDFEDDYYNEKGQLVLGKRSKLAAIEKDLMGKVREEQDKLTRIESDRTEQLAKRQRDEDKIVQTYNDQVSALEQEIKAQQQALEIAKNRLAFERLLDEQRNRNRDKAAQAIAEARVEADKLKASDPAAAEEYFALRSRHILAAAKLEQEMFEAQQDYDYDRYLNLQAQRDLLNQVHAAEQAVFLANVSTSSPYAKLTEEITSLQNKLQAELERDQGFYNQTDKNNLKMRNKIANEIAADKAALQQITSLLSMIGSASMDGIAAGVDGGTAGLLDAITAAMGQAQNAAEAALGIKSPSKVMEMSVGLPIMQGITAGIERGFGDTRLALGNSLQSLQTVRPIASSQQIANSYAYSDSVNIGSFNAMNGVSRREVNAMISQAMVRSGRTAYTRMRTR